MRLGLGGFGGEQACVPGSSSVPNLGLGGLGMLVAFVPGESFIWTRSTFCTGDAAWAPEAAMASPNETATICFSKIFFIEYLHCG